jgi:isopentenyldiphosphate isomerase
LLPVDEAGRGRVAPAEVPADYWALAAREPEFTLWFRIQGESILAARWLCHLAGLRHRTVELFIDHPSLPGYALIQVRSPAKREYPACFDLPAAGHVVGGASVIEGLHQELAEELGLDATGIEDLRVLGGYVHAEEALGGAIRDVEQRTVYRCRLRAGHLERVRFADGEVAALAVFALPALHVMLNDYPERFASGLAASFPLYLRSLADSESADPAPAES